MMECIANETTLSTDASGKEKKKGKKIGSFSLIERVILSAGAMLL